MKFETDLSLEHREFAGEGKDPVFTVHIDSLETSNIDKRKLIFSFPVQRNE